MGGRHGGNLSSCLSHAFRKQLTPPIAAAGHTSFGPLANPALGNTPQQFGRNRGNFPFNTAIMARDSVSPVPDIAVRALERERIRQ
jgi:hypothetical protein